MSDFYWDFAAVLVLLTFVSGLIWAIDIAFFAKSRYARLRAEVGDADEEGDSELIDQPPLLVDYARSFFPIFVIVLLLRSFLVEPFRIPSGSMLPTLLIGDFILVNKYDYGIRLPVLNRKVLQLGEPQRGDVIVFRYPVDPSTPFIKRVVGVPGDKIAYRNKQLYVNGNAVGYEHKGSYIIGRADGSSTVATRLEENLTGVEHDILLVSRRQSQRVDFAVPPGQYFVLGDNRDNSKDSRYWGTVPDENLIGRAFMIWMNWDGGPGWGRIGTRIQ